MDEINMLCDEIKERFINSAPNIWERLKRSAARQIAEQLINELNGIPSNCGKLIYEQVNEILPKGKVA